ncbi:hypothetical protein GGI07_001698 [Coemansia sp. Benny D115]|nr:hypothetical protein GGI07_001698 [Coemansia sp. Benny D115]
MKKLYFSRRLFVTGYPAAVTHGELTTPFEEFGRVVGTKLILANGPDEFPYAFIEFNTSIDATTARNKMHQSLMRGQRLEVHFDSKIPPQYRPQLDDLRDYQEPPVSHQPEMHRNDSQESVPQTTSAQNASVSDISPRSSPDRAEPHHEHHDKSDQPPSKYERSSHYHERKNEYHSRYAGPPRSRYEPAGYHAPERRWPASGYSGDRAGPVRHRNTRHYTSGPPPYGGYQGGRPYARRSPREAGGGGHGYYSGSRAPPRGAPYAREKAYHGPSRHHGHYDNEHYEQYREDDDRSSQGSFSPRMREYAKGSRPRSPYVESERRSANGEEYENRSYGNMTPPRGSPPPLRSYNEGSQVSLNAYKSGGSWESAKGEAGLKEADDEGLSVAPEIRPRNDN